MKFFKLSFARKGGFATEEEAKQKRAPWRRLAKNIKKGTKSQT
jgi:hypothetical protein